MEKIIDKNIILFNIALEYDIIDISIITSWADNHILNNEIDVNDYFIIELSWAHTKERIQEILMDEIYKRQISSLKISGNLFFFYLKQYDLSSITNVIFVIDTLLVLTHEVEFTQKELTSIYYVDECRDEYLKGIMSFNKVREELMLLLERSNVDKDMHVRQKTAIRNLLEEYSCDKVNTIDFCNKIYEWYDICDYKDGAEPNEKKWLDELSTITGRYSEFSEDHKLAPKAFTTESDIKAKVREILNIFNRNESKNVNIKLNKKMKEVGTKGISYNNVYSIENNYGKSKPIDEVTLQDMQENPIWIFALDEEDSDEVDESWLKPILKSDNVMSEFVEAYILLKSTDGQYDISTNLDIKKEALDDVTFWKPEQQCWIPIENIDNYREMQLIAVPKIEKENDILFEFDSSKNLFSSLRSQAQLKEKKKTIFSFFTSLFKRK